MKVIIAGIGKGIKYSDVVEAIEESGFDITTVVSGTASGVDTFGELWAQHHNIPIERYPANWEEHGKSAGYIRNGVMADNAEALIAIWNGSSRGTKHMIDTAKKRDLKVYIYIVGDYWKIEDDI